MPVPNGFPPDASSGTIHGKVERMTRPLSCTGVRAVQLPGGTWLPGDPQSGEAAGVLHHRPPGQQA